MNADDRFIIEPLGKQHDRKDFSCGNPKLDHYLQRQASQDVKRKITRVFIAAEDQATNIIGFHTLSALSIEAENLPNSIARKLPKHPLPAALIGRLAVHQGVQGKGVGRMLLMDALKRTLLASETIAIFAIIVDAKDSQVMSFYETFGFQAFDDSKRLFLSISDLIN